MNRDAIINALIQYVEGGWQDMKLGSSFWALFMFMHIQMNVILSTTGPILQQGPSKLALQNHKHSSPFSTLQRGLWMEDELRLVGCFLQEVLGIKELFVIIVKYGNVQEMTCGFVHTVTVALTQQSVKEYTCRQQTDLFYRPWKKSLPDWWQNSHRLQMSQDFSPWKWSAEHPQLPSGELVEKGGHSASAKLNSLSLESKATSSCSVRKYFQNDYTANFSSVE